MIEVKNKDQMFDLLISGKFGNTARIWPTLNDFYKSGYTGPVIIRFRAGRPQHSHYKNVPYEKISSIISDIYKSGYNESYFYLSEWIPEEDLVMICQLMRSERTLELTYKSRPNWKFFNHPIKGGLNQHYAWGLEAKLILLSVMAQDLYEFITDLFDEYSNSVIEFNVYARSMGLLYQNIQIVEIRNY